MYTSYFVDYCNRRTGIYVLVIFMRKKISMYNLAGIGTHTEPVGGGKHRCVSHIYANYYFRGFTVSLASF